MECKIVQPFWKSSLTDPHSPHDPAMALNRNLSRKNENTHPYNLHTILLVALFVTVQTANNPKVHKFVNKEIMIPLSNKNKYNANI